MYGIFTYIWLILMVNIGKYTSPMDPMGWDLPKKLFSRNTGNLRFPGWSCHDCMLDATCFGTCWICLVSGETRWLGFSNADLSWLKKKHNLSLKSNYREWVQLAITSNSFEMFLKLFTGEQSEFQILFVYKMWRQKDQQLQTSTFWSIEKWRCHLHFLKIKIHGYMDEKMCVQCC